VPTLSDTVGSEQRYSVDSKQEALEKWIPVLLVILGAIAYVASMFF
jgi:hypothetical protein